MRTRFEKIALPLLIGAVAVGVGVSFGYSIWYFAAGSQQVTTNKTKVDDIAENYSFASQASDQPYTLYFFPSPDAAKYHNKDYHNNYNSLFANSSTIYVAFNGDFRGFAYNATKGYYLYNTYTFYDTSKDVNTIYSTSSATYSQPVDYITYGNNPSYEHFNPMTDGTAKVFSYTDSTANIKYYFDPTHSTDGNYIYTYPTAVSSQSFTSPVAYYDYQKTEMTTPYYKNTNAGFWGNMTASSTYRYGDTRFNYGVVNPDASNTSSDSYFGYKTISKVYSQLKMSQYETLGDLFCTLEDNTSKGYYDYFTGFTTDEQIAASNFNYVKYGNTWRNTFTKPSTDLFDLTKPLSSYDTDGDHKIYLYALYTNGKDLANVKVPSLHMVPSTWQNKVYEYQWIFSPSEKSYSLAPDGSLVETETDTALMNPSTGNDKYLLKNIPWYYSMKNVYVSKTTPASGALNTVFYKDQNYTFGAKSLKSNYDSTDAFTFNSGSATDTAFSAALKAKLQSDCLYNFYIYYNQMNGDVTAANMLDSAVNKALEGKNIIYESDPVLQRNVSDAAGGSTCYMKLYVERVYDYKVAGDITGGYGYHDSVTSFELKSSTDVTEAGVTKHEQTYETKLVNFSSAASSKFVINYGDHYAASVLSADTAAYATSDLTSSLTSTATPTDSNAALKNDGSQYKDANDNYAYYQKDNFTIEDASLSANNVANQNLAIIKMTSPGGYKLRIKVIYTDGVPTSIRVSAAKISGYFLEIFASNPTSKLTGAYSDFVDHVSTPYVYRTDRFENNIITLDDAVFYAYGSTTDPKSLRSILTEHGTSALLYDHVTGQKIEISLADHVTASGTTIHGGFTTDSGLSWRDNFTLDKNYVFYFAA